MSLEAQGLDFSPVISLVWLVSLRSVQRAVRKVEERAGQVAWNSAVASSGLKSIGPRLASRFRELLESRLGNGRRSVVKT
jgi:hypothetical protein